MMRRLRTSKGGDTVVQGMLPRLMASSTATMERCVSVRAPGLHPCRGRHGTAHHASSWQQPPPPPPAHPGMAAALVPARPTHQRPSPHPARIENVTAGARQRNQRRRKNKKKKNDVRQAASSCSPRRPAGSVQTARAAAAGRPRAIARRHAAQAPRQAHLRPRRVDLVVVSHPSTTSNFSKSKKKKKKSKKKNRSYL